MATKKKRKAPWKRPAPPKNRSKNKRAKTHLSPARKKAAKRRAKQAGRPYPNLVDNMHEAAASTKKKKNKKKSRAGKKKRKKATTPRKTTRRKKR